MLAQPKAVAPEPYFSGYLELLDRVFIFPKNHSEGDERLPDQQLFDLVDAIHNISAMLLEYDSRGWDDNVTREIFLEAYDKKWVRDECEFGLVTVLVDAIRCVHKRDGGKCDAS